MKSLLFVTIGLLIGADDSMGDVARTEQANQEDAVVKKELAELQGWWECKGVIGVGTDPRGGEALFYGDKVKPGFGSLLKQAVLEIKGDTFTFADTPARRATVKLDPGQSPKALDLTDAKGRTWLGIYDLKDDTLTINLGLGKTRPKKVTYGANGTFGQVNVSYKRAMKVTLSYRVKADAVAPSSFSAVIAGHKLDRVKLRWDLLETQQKAKKDFEHRIKMLEEKQINGVSFAAEGFWVKKGEILRLITVPRLTEAGKQRIKDSGR